MTDPTPTPPDGCFASDNAAGVSPEVLDALVEANAGPALAYGDDSWTRRPAVALRERLEAHVVAGVCVVGPGGIVDGRASELHPGLGELS
ncbi:MAG: threonine aldolase, partial [Acidimicrobiales bacterium]